MLSTILSFSLCDVLPLIKNRGEATALISVLVVSQQLSSSSQALYLSVENELLLLNLQQSAIESNKSRLNVALCPLIHTAIALVKQRYLPQISAVNSILEDLSRLNVTIRMYSEQNTALAREFFSAGCMELSAVKQNIATFETEICRRIDHIKKLSWESASQESLDLLAEFPVLRLATAQRMSDLRTPQDLSNSSIIHRDTLKLPQNLTPLFSERDESRRSLGRKRKHPVEDQENAAIDQPDGTTPLSHPLASCPFSIVNSSKMVVPVALEDELFEADEDGSEDYKGTPKCENKRSARDRLNHFGDSSVRDTEKQLKTDGDAGDDIRNISMINNDIYSQHLLRGTKMKFGPQCSDGNRDDVGMVELSCSVKSSSMIDNAIYNDRTESSKSVSVSDCDEVSSDYRHVHTPVDKIGALTSTPTSSQTAFIGDNEDSSECKNKKKRRKGGVIDRPESVNSSQPVSDASFHNRDADDNVQAE